MKEIVLHLDEQDFKEVPTKTQTSNICRDMSKFLNNLAAALVIDGQYMASDAQCGEMFNTATKLKAIAEFIDNPNPQSNAGLLVPQPGPQVVRR